MIEIEGAVAKLELRPGDAVVIKLRHPASYEQLDMTRAWWREHFPEHCLILVDPSVEEITILRGADGIEAP